MLFAYRRRVPDTLSLIYRVAQDSFTNQGPFTKRISLKCIFNFQHSIRDPGLKSWEEILWLVLQPRPDSTHQPRAWSPWRGPNSSPFTRRAKFQMCTTKSVTTYSTPKNHSPASMPLLKNTHSFTTSHKVLVQQKGKYFAEILACEEDLARCTSCMQVLSHLESLTTWAAACLAYGKAIQSKTDDRLSIC